MSYTSVDTSARHVLPAKDGADHPAAVKFKDLPVRLSIMGWDAFVQHRYKNFSFTDCTSFAFMKRIWITGIFASGEHFTQYGNFTASLLARMRLRSRTGVGNGD